MKPHLTRFAAQRVLPFLRSSSSAPSTQLDLRGATLDAWTSCDRGKAGVKRACFQDLSEQAQRIANDVISSKNRALTMKHIYAEITNELKTGADLDSSAFYSARPHPPSSPAPQISKVTDAPPQHRTPENGVFIYTAMPVFSHPYPLNNAHILSARPDSSNHTGLQLWQANLVVVVVVEFDVPSINSTNATDPDKRIARGQLRNIDRLIIQAGLNRGKTRAPGILRRDVAGGKSSAGGEDGAT